MSWRCSSKYGFFSKCAIFSFDPVKKLSTQSTSQRSLSRRSHRCEPKNPAPPVTSIFFMSPQSFRQDDTDARCQTPDASAKYAVIGTSHQSPVTSDPLLLAED